MSVFEVLLLAGAVGLALAGWAPASGRGAATLTAAALAAMSAAAVVVAGLRWQLVPVLVGALLGLLLAVLRWRRPADRQGHRTRRRLVAIGSGITTTVCLGLIAAGPAAAWAFPVAAFPEPSGSRPVGTTVVQWSDPARPEPATPDPHDRRVIVAQLWYPAQPSPAGTPRAMYLGRTEQEARIVASGVATYLGIPAFLLDGAVGVHTHAVPDAAPAGGERFPVVLFSPGLGGVRTQNTAWAEDLASRGYAVVALDHPYDSAAVQLADGRVVRSRLDSLTSGETDPERQRARWAAIRAADLRFALTQLDRGQAPGRLAGRLDTHRVAAAGHSLGGRAAVHAARQDPRFRAAVALDGIPEPASAPFPQPVLALVGPASQNDHDLARVLDASTAPSYRVVVPAAAHLSFTDAPLYLPPVPALVGSMDRHTGPRMTAEATTAFLDVALRAHPADELATHLRRYGRLTVFEP